ncbi:TPA: hypothetical protein ACGUPM_002669 [Vibrio vulnificus]
MKVKLKHLWLFLTALVVGLSASLYSVTASATEIVNNAFPPDAPAWIGTAIGFVVAAAGLVAQLDAQVSEDFKHKWPWWLRVPWDALAGNYKHSKNIGSV